MFRGWELALIFALVALILIRAAGTILRVAMEHSGIARRIRRRAFRDALALISNAEWQKGLQGEVSELVADLSDAVPASETDD